jgi:hypothetical protein
MSAPYISVKDLAKLLEKVSFFFERSIFWKEKDKTIVVDVRTIDYMRYKIPGFFLYTLLLFSRFGTYIQ